MNADEAYKLGYPACRESTAKAAATLTRKEYNSQGWKSIARQAAYDFDYPLCENIDVIPAHCDNVGAAILKMLDEIKGTNTHAAYYPDLIIKTGANHPYISYFDMPEEVKRFE